ncbi:hypothetical protein D9M71_503500 [compost metagenome]
MHDIGQFCVSYAFLTIGDGTNVHVVTVDIAVHQRQTRNPDGGEVVVIAHLPGVLLRVVEAGVEAVVGQAAAAGAVDAHPLAVAGEFLQANVERTAANLGGEQARVDLVVDFSGQFAAVIVVLEIAEVGAQGPVSDRLAMQ